MRTIHFVFCFVVAGCAFGDTLTSNADLEFSHITECLVLPGACIEGRFDSHLVVTLLNGRGKICLGLIGSEVEDWDGAPATQLLDIGCDDPNDFILAIVSPKKYIIKQFELLELKDISDPKIINELNQKISKQGLFDIAKVEFARKPLPTIKGLALPAELIYLVDYDSIPGPFFIVTSKGILAPISSDRCGGPIRAFLLNGQYYLEYGECGCETDACGTGFIKLSDISNGRISGNG